MSFHLSPRRLTAAAALGVAAVLACAVPASAAPADAATWLSGPALTDGNHLFYGTPGGDPNTDYAIDGATADAVYALTAAGGHDDTVRALDAYLQTVVASYADPAGADPGFPGPYSGSLAKLSLVAETTGGNPHAYGGYDLLKVLVDKTCTAPTADGTCSAPGEFYQSFSTISQALGVIALQRSPIAADHLDVTSAPVTRLAALRCADGLYTGSLLAPGDTCATGDADTTAYVVQALAAVSGPDDVSVTAALTALAAAQDAQSGGFAGASGINSNTTGVALSAFSLQKTAFAAQITAGENFIQSLQQSDGRYAVTAADPSVPSAKVATPQALLGALGRNLADPTLVLAAPTTPPTTTAPTTGAPAPASASAPELAATGVASGHLTTELLLAAVALVGGGALLRVGARRLPAARHRG